MRWFAITLAVWAALGWALTVSSQAGQEGQTHLLRVSSDSERISPRQSQPPPDGQQNLLYQRRQPDSSTVILKDPASGQQREVKTPPASPGPGPAGERGEKALAAPASPGRAVTAGRPKPDPARERERAIGLAWQAYNAGDFARARRLFARGTLAGDRAKQQEARLGLAYSQARLGLWSKAEFQLARLVQQGYKPAETRPLLSEMRLRLAQEHRRAGRGEKAADILTGLVAQGYRLDSTIDDLKETAGPTSAAFLCALEELLENDPGQDQARSELAWACRRAGDLGCALEQFTALLARQPRHQDYLAGMMQTLVDLKRDKEALALLDQAQGKPSPRVQEIARLARANLGRRALEQGRPEEAEAHLRSAWEGDKNDRGVAESLAWALMKLGRPAQAVPIFEGLSQTGKEQSSFQGLLLSLEQAGQKEKLERLLGGRDVEAPPGIKRLVAEAYHQRGLDILAAQVGGDEEACWVNHDTAKAGVSAIYRQRSGDAGTSRLTEASLPLSLGWTTEGGRQWQAGWVERGLDSGSSTAAPYLGRYYRRLADPGLRPSQPATSLWLSDPWFSFRQEGFTTWGIALGSTPLEGPVSTRPTGEITLQSPGRWRLQLHQEPVRESILSWAGQRDIYSGQPWGRVLKSGLEAQASLPIQGPWWWSAGVAWDYYWGENVASNQGWVLDLAAGRSDKWGRWELASGLFFTLRGFEKNQDFFTWGHGGYFSPSLFAMAGPFANLQLHHCQDFSLRLKASLGYMTYNTADAPHYPLAGEDAALLGSGSADYLGRYQGESKSGLGGNTYLEAQKLVSRHVSAGAFLGFDASTNHQEGQAGLTINFYWQPLNALPTQPPRPR